MMGALDTAVTQIAGLIKTDDAPSYMQAEDRRRAESQIRGYLEPALTLEAERDAYKRIAEDQAAVIAHLQIELMAAQAQSAGQPLVVSLSETDIDLIRAAVTPRAPRVGQSITFDERRFFDTYCTIERVESARAGWHEGRCTGDHGAGDWITTGLESVVEDALYDHIQQAHDPRTPKEKP